MSYAHILVAVDLTSSSQKVIDKAISLAKGENSKISLVFVDVDRVVLEPKDKQSLEEQIKTLADQSTYPIDNALIVVGDLHMKLSGIVKETGVDLVVCGHHHKLWSRLFSSVPKVANAVEADLLVVYLDK
ncbi:universal stress protein [Vibrio japonicus]|uniref:Universal stress protein n=1 Tax=Vibrio japonicus TaxID=1824638 RepID=A0ABY5LM82_9VIBR|nr:universal stress protein [Vibrio japonicus]UUM32010.1 universal stress protein [Vibrio japonicus]